MYPELTDLFPHASYLPCTYIIEHVIAAGGSLGMKLWPIYEAYYNNYITNKLPPSVRIPRNCIRSPEVKQTT